LAARLGLDDPLGPRHRLVAAVATVVLIVLSALPAQRTAPVTTETTPATVLGTTDTMSTSGAGE
jgi:hypothetical protein